MTDYWAAVYAREKTYSGPDLRWRMRDMKEHPCDPGWERGDCSECHRQIREQAEAGDLLFDIVFPKDAKSNAPRVVRSAMPITRAEDGTLHFDSYIFLNGNWRKGIPAAEGETESWLAGAPLWRGRGTLTERTAVDWLETMNDAKAYTTYEAGQRPQSIPDEHWQEMIQRCYLSSEGMSEEGCRSALNQADSNQNKGGCTRTC